MNRNKNIRLLVSLLLIFVLSILPVQAAELTITGPEKPALVIGGSSISRGRGFLHNYVAITPSEMDDIAASGSGTATYRLGLGDCFTEALTYSTYENHGTPAWIYRRVYGLDLKTMAEALGINTNQVMSICVYADDGMTKTLSDAFGAETTRWSYGFTGKKQKPVSPVLALFETTTETQELEKGILPDIPVLERDSPDRVDNVFGYGQTDIQEITSCYWVKEVRRLRFGSEESALTVRDVSGNETDISLSTLIRRGIWKASIGSIKAEGVPVSQLLTDLGIHLSEGNHLRIHGINSDVDLSADQLSGAFVAWQATDTGSAVSNATPLRLYYQDGKVLPDLISFDLIPPSEADPSASIIPAFNDLDGYDWARDAVSELSQRGIIKGLSADSFGPGLNIRRGDFMLMLARAYHLNAASDDNFQDVSVDSYYYDAVAAARALNIARGDGEFFYPQSSITRQEAMTLIYRTLTMTGYSFSEENSALDGFNDGDLVAEWAGIPVSSLVSVGVIQGSNNSVNPLGKLTRAEMAVILKRALELR